MSGPWVSVITRTKDRRELFREALASVAAQTWPYVQYVVVNDGGESVADLLEPHRDNLDITYLEPGAVGRCRAGNVGLAAARGEWIAYLDDDDLYLPEHLQTLVEHVVKTPYKFIYSDAWQVDQVREEGTGTWCEVSRSIPYSEDFNRTMLLRRAYIHLVTVLHHRECFERLGGFDESLEVLEDHDLFFRYAQDYDFLHLARPTACFRIRNDQSNAVTALRAEFVETRAMLFSRYAHIALPEIMDTMDHGERALTSAMAQIASLQSALAETQAQLLELNSRLARLEQL